MGTPGLPLTTPLQSGKVHVKSYFRILVGKGPGALNDGFLPNALKHCFRLYGVLVKLCRLKGQCHELRMRVFLLRFDPRRYSSAIMDLPVSAQSLHVFCM